MPFSVSRNYLHFLACGPFLTSFKHLSSSFYHRSISYKLSKFTFRLLHYAEVRFSKLNNYFPIRRLNGFPPLFLSQSSSLTSLAFGTADQFLLKALFFGFCDCVLCSLRSHLSDYFITFLLFFFHNLKVNIFGS